MRTEAEIRRALELALATKADEEDKILRAALEGMLREIEICERAQRQ